MNASRVTRFVPKGIQGLHGQLAHVDVLSLATRMTLLLLIIYSNNWWYVRVPMRIFCAAGIMASSLYLSSGFWFTLGIIMAWGNALNWYKIDNHQYLMTYWCLALSVSLGSPDSRRILKENACLLIGLCFAFAVLWKAFLSPDYMSGSFFQFTLLTDRRFRAFASIMGGMTEEMRILNGVRLEQMENFRKGFESVDLLYPPQLVQLAHWMTWGTVLIETSIAVAFLWPWPGRISSCRHFLLILFAGTIYAVANVPGFAWLLIVMGVAQCEPELKYTRWLYVLVFFLIQIYTVPWSTLVSP
jgi:hypothetical protein